MSQAFMKFHGSLAHPISRIIGVDLMVDTLPCTPKHRWAHDTSLVRTRSCSSCSGPERRLMHMGHSQKDIVCFTSSMIRLECWGGTHIWCYFCVCSALLCGPAAIRAHQKPPSNQEVLQELLLLFAAPMKHSDIQDDKGELSLSVSNKARHCVLPAPLLL